jgi:flagellar hook-associated protein 1 FlgK
VVNIQASEVVVGKLPNGKEDRRFQVTINGSYLVNHFNTYELETFQINEGSHRDGMYGIQWAKSGNEMLPKGGELKGYLDIRDGNGEAGQYKGIPYYIEKLDEFARSFATAFNEGVLKDGEQHYAGHAGGVGLDGSIGTKFFSYEDRSSAELVENGYDKLTAANISISSDVENDIYKIATASVGGEAGNNGNIASLLELRHESKMFNEGAPEDFMKSLVAMLGVDAQQAVRVSGNQENLVQQIDNRRLSLSGVSVDEEMANMVKYQHAYNAAAKMITVMDEIYDTLINRVGV